MNFAANHETYSKEFRNSIMRSWRADAMEFLNERALTRDIAAGEILHHQGEKLTQAIFPHSGVISLIPNQQQGRAIEMASIGAEGFIGITLIMGGGPMNANSTVMVPGRATFVAIEDIDAAMMQFRCVRTSMLRYAKCLIDQLMHSVACNSLHTAEQRIAKWLLHAADRMESNRIPITHERLAAALGLRRATVSNVYADLIQDGCVTSSRGTLTVTDPQALERHACSCYGNIRQIFEEAEKIPAYELPPLRYPS